MKKRMIYAMITLLLLAVEVVIALFVHDNFIRPYIGDVLVVIVIYMFLRTWIPDKLKLLPVYIFLFATGVEMMQYFQLVKLLGLEDNSFFRILLGSVFDGKDILCYAVGCLLLVGYEIFLNKGVKN